MQIGKIVDSYVECLLRSSIVSFIEEGDSEVIFDYADEYEPHKTLIDQSTQDIILFINKLIDLGIMPLLDTEELKAQFGHDYALTRNGHGSGFWDREHIWGENRDKITQLCENNTVDLYLNDDKEVCIQ
jgi:hypothetical protein